MKKNKGDRRKHNKIRSVKKRKGPVKKKIHFKKKSRVENDHIISNKFKDKNESKRKVKENNEVEDHGETSTSDEEIEDPVQQLLSTFSENKNNNLVVSDSDESDNNDGEEQVSTSQYAEEDNEIDAINNLSDKAFIESESIEEQELDTDMENEEKCVTVTDTFTQHLKDELSQSLLDSVSSVPQVVEKHYVDWPCLGKIDIQIPKVSQNEHNVNEEKQILQEKKTFAQPGNIPIKIGKLSLDKVDIKKQIQNNVSRANKNNLLRRDRSAFNYLTDLQKEIFSIINNYQDLYYPQRSFINGEEIRFTYCLHAVNHVLKTRIKIIHHNAKLQKKDTDSDEFRDQGLVRPKVLIIVPFKDSAYRIVNIISNLLVPDDSTKVINKNRFEEDFTGNEITMPKKNPKPDDYELTFAGNSDDTFRIGLSITKKSVKLFTEFYSSDIIIASPLGLRMIIGAEGEEERDYDFLASIELLILDQSEIFLMQNWDHILHIVDHLHLQPKKSHETDFSRLRLWAVNGWTKYYRQTLIFSSVILPEINALFNKKCFNYAGKFKVQNYIEMGSIRQVTIQVPQIFCRIEAQDPVSAIEMRFNHFITDVLNQYKDNIMAHTLIYVPSYFDYVRIRNYFKKEEISFVQICEYSKDTKVARARDLFFHTEAHFLLYSERFHFFRRIQIKGIRHIIFYQPPTFPHFYPELCNFMQEANQNRHGGSESNMTVTVLYTKYDLNQVSAIVGSERTVKMFNSDKNIHMFMTGE